MSEERDDAVDALQSSDARDALLAVRNARASLAARAVTPWWYPPAYGLGMGGLVASLALPPRLSALAMAGCALYMLGVYALWRRISGLSVPGYRPGRTRYIAIGIAVACAGFCALAIGLREVFPDGRVAVLGGIAMAFIAARGSIAWDRAWRAELVGDLP